MQVIQYLQMLPGKITGSKPKRNWNDTQRFDLDGKWQQRENTIQVQGEVRKKNKKLQKTIW